MYEATLVHEMLVRFYLLDSSCSIYCIWMSDAHTTFGNIHLCIVHLGLAAFLDQHPRHQLFQQNAAFEDCLGQCSNLLYHQITKC